MAECERCRVLREEASFAIRRNIDAQGRRDVAALRHDREQVRALEELVSQTSEARQKAVAALREHIEWHGEPGTAQFRETGAS